MPRTYSSAFWYGRSSMNARTGSAKHATSRIQKYSLPGRGAYSISSSRMPTTAPNTTRTIGICTSWF